jgi:hypothetical protein
MAKPEQDDFAHVEERRRDTRGYTTGYRRGSVIAFRKSG